VASRGLRLACEPFGEVGPLLGRYDDARCQVGTKIAGRILSYQGHDESGRERAVLNASESLRLPAAECGLGVCGAYAGFTGFTGFSSTGPHWPSRSEGLS
jgi:hypothetical protein